MASPGIDLSMNKDDLMDTRKNEGTLSSPARRTGFSTALGTLFATLGSAIGLGNIWKFPYLTGANGGAAFILVYIISTLLVGLPVMIAEIMLVSVTLFL